VGLLARKAAPKISFLAFFVLWAERMRWDIPPLHVRVCQWLEHCWRQGGDLWLLMLPRGHAKSTILEIFNAWLYYIEPRIRLLHQSESDGTALKTSRGTQNVLRHHPLTAGLLPPDCAVEQWWTEGSKEIDPRNASMYAKGILSNVTSSRADLIQNDDIEVPKNIGTEEAREKLRFRLGEQVHIAVPGAPTLYIGTPHTHDSIYSDVKAMGAEAMIVRMFAKEYRIEAATDRRYNVGFRPDFVFSGIGKPAKLLREGVDYKVEGTFLVLADPGGELIDCYAGAAWPERFDAEEMQKRRRRTRTIGEWDSQYQLHAKPVGNVRLDPARIIPYNVEPALRSANGAAMLYLGSRQIIGVACKWDPSSGKVNSDSSAVAIVYQDADGRRYAHRVQKVEGEIAIFDDDGKTIKGGQVWQLADLVEKFNIPRVTVETNGVGAFAPAVLRACFKQRRIKAAVVDHQESRNKNKRILEAIEPLLLSRGMLWAHVDVLQGELWNEMREWKPNVTAQADDHCDVLAGAIDEQPERVSAKGGIPPPREPEDWRHRAHASSEVTFDRS
jgi:hypothetical protein